MEVLVDTSIWIDYLKSGDNSSDMDSLIDKNLLLTNDIIQAELIPSPKIKKQTKVIELLQNINRTPLKINWENYRVPGTVFKKWCKWRRHSRFDYCSKRKRK